VHRATPTPWRFKSPRFTGVVPQRVLHGDRTPTGPAPWFTAPGPSSCGTYFVHSAHGMFQPLRPLDGETVGSVEFFTTTTSPAIEWLKNQAAGTPLS
jgi:hypothetical protein